MNCSANKSRKGCAQGHQPCPTPYTCSYADDALYAPLRDMPTADEPITTPQAAMKWARWALIAAGLLAWFALAVWL